MARIGGAWKQKTKKGDTYLSCLIEVNGQKIKFSIFPNSEKKNDKSPDYNIVTRDAQPAGELGTQVDGPKWKDVPNKPEENDLPF